MVAELIAGAVALWEWIGEDFLKSKTLQQLDTGVQQAWQRAQWANAVFATLTIQNTML